MMKSATGVNDSALSQDPGAPKPDEIRQQLRAILTSPAFLGSKRSQQFLEYVCEKSLHGEGSSLKERTIAIEVFGRQPESDLGEDTIVRVSAREVRKRLVQFYSSPEGSASPIKVELPSGSYAPDFHFPAPSLPREEAAPHVLAIIPSPQTKRRRIYWLVAAALMSIVAAAVVAHFVLPNPNLRAFRTFWEPVMSSGDPLLIAVAHPIVYHPSNRAQKLSLENQPKRDPLQRPIQVPPEKLNGNDLVPVFNQYVGFGDMVVATEVSSMLATKGKPVRLRMASNVEFADLRKAPTLLIGAVTNRWTVEFQQSWRFRIDYTPGARSVITDSAPGDSKREWVIGANDDGSTLDDYLMICRIRSLYTGGVLMVAAGLKQFGTEAAGHLISDPEQLGPILRKLPAGWESQNVQLVLHARVIGNTPAQPEVVATHVW